jgi:lipopolysaccharide export system protein LptA
MRKPLFLAAFATLAVPASAQVSGLETSKPIAVNADNFIADLAGETGTYTGNVVVTQGAVKLHADKVLVAAPGGKASRMEATGHVVVDSPSGTAVGDRGTYDVAAETVRLAGNVVLTKDNNVLRGNALDVHMRTGEAKLVGAPTASGTGRVQGLFVPKTRETQ